MRIIEIAPLENGAHRNQTIGNGFYFSKLPAGWAIIPADMETPNFPFGEVEVAEIDGVMTVTEWTAGTMPEPEPEAEPEPTQMDRIEAQVTYTAMMTDTLLEV
jgi:hypothetical protein